MSLREEADALAPDLVELRRRIHREPEVGLDLPRTQEKVLDALRELDLEVHLGTDTTSVTAVLEGATDGPTVLLRADMDALPLPEETGLDFASTEPAMHACGHDLHTSILVGAARLLAAHRAELAGRVLFMFQPGEEGYDGAGVMLREGLLEIPSRRPVAAYGLHVQSTEALGTVISRPGPLMAAFSVLTVTVNGKGGHGARPHTALDPIPVACETVSAIYNWVARRSDAFDPVIVTVGQIAAGSAPNIIPEQATLVAGVRTFSDKCRGGAAAGLTTLCRAIAEAHELTAEVTWEDRYPVLETDPDETEFGLGVARDLFGDEQVHIARDPYVASEDFARILAEVDGTYLFVGARPEAIPAEEAEPVHSPRVVFDEAAIPAGVTLLAELALRRTAATTPREASALSAAAH